MHFIHLLFHYYSFVVRTQWTNQLATLPENQTMSVRPQRSMGRSSLQSELSLVFHEHHWNWMCWMLIVVTNYPSLPFVSGFFRKPVGIPADRKHQSGRSRAQNLPLPLRWPGRPRWRLDATSRNDSTHDR